MENEQNIPKKSRTKWIVIVALIVLVLIFLCAACIGFTVMNSEELGSTSEANSRFNIRGNTKETIAVINMEGIIMDAAETTYEQNIVDYAVESLEKAKDDENVRAVLLVLNTPGGSTYDTAKIGDKIDEVKAADKLVVSLMEQTAASGGYWIAAKSDYIITGPETITGSVGALWDIILYDELLEKIGVDQLTINNVGSPNKTIGDSETSNPESEKYKILQDLANNSYNEFVDVILEGRNKTKEELGKYLDGRIIDGRQAVEAGMADQLGYYDDAVNYIQEELGLESPNVEAYERERMSPFNSLFVKLNLIGNQMPESQMRMRMMYMPSFTSSSENN